MENYFIYDKENSAESVIYSYLLENCTQELFEKAKKQGKNIADAIQYVISEIKDKAKNNCYCTTSDEVFGLIIHYFEEESIEKENQKVLYKSTNTKPKAKAKTKAEEEEQEEPKPKKKPKAKAKKKQKEVKETEPKNVGYEQISLLDLL